MRYNLLQFPRSSVLWKLQFPAQGTPVSCLGNYSFLPRKLKQIKEQIKIT